MLKPLTEDHILLHITLKQTFFFGEIIPRIALPCRSFEARNPRPPPRVKKTTNPCPVFGPGIMTRIDRPAALGLRENRPRLPRGNSGFFEQPAGSSSRPNPCVYSWPSFFPEAKAPSCSHPPSACDHPVGPEVEIDFGCAPSARRPFL